MRLKNLHASNDSSPLILLIWHSCRVEACHAQRAQSGQKEEASRLKTVAPVRRGRVKGGRSHIISKTLFLRQFALAPDEKSAKNSQLLHYDKTILPSLKLNYNDGSMLRYANCTNTDPNLKDIVQCVQTSTGFLFSVNGIGCCTCRCWPICGQRKRINSLEDVPRLAEVCSLIACRN